MEAPRSMNCFFLVGFYLLATSALHPGVTADDVALGKQATQLGVWGGYGPELAVDGDKRQSLWDDSCAHPDKTDRSLSDAEKQQSVYWSVDLASNNHSERFVVVNVTIYFRADCCDDKIDGTVIHIGEEADLQQQTECGRTPSREIIQTITCSSNTPVRYVTVWHPSNNVMTLCEVIVNGYRYAAADTCPSGQWGPNCQYQCPSCNSNECDAISGNCKDCPAGSFGTGCTSSCRCRDVNEVCNPRDGFCQNGCADGYWGLNCSNPLPSVQGRPTLVRSTQTSVTLSFTPSIQQVDEYEVEYAVDNRNSLNYVLGTRVQHSNGAYLEVTLTQLQPGTGYWFRIVPYVNNRKGTESEPAYATTLALPLAPGQPTVVRSTQSSVTLSFTTLVQQVDEYQVEYAIRNRNSPNYVPGVRVQHTNEASLEVTQTNLQLATSYQFRIVPYVNNIKGRESDPTYATTLEIPEMESDPTTSSVTSTSVIVEFEPSDPPADSYRIQYRTRTTNYQDGPLTRGANIPRYNIRLDNLSPNTQYEIRVVPLYGQPETEGYPAQSVFVTTSQGGQPTPAPTPTPTTTTTTPTPRPPPVVTPEPTTPTPRGDNPPPAITSTTPSPDKSTEAPGPTVKAIGGDGGGSGGSGGTIAGIIVAVIIILIIAIVIFVLIRRSRKGKPVPILSKVDNYVRSMRKKGKSADKPLEDPNAGAVVVDDKQVIIEVPPPSPQTPASSTPPTPVSTHRENIYGNASLMPAIKVQDLAKYIQAKKNQTDAFKEEFKKLPIGPTAKWDVGNKQENRNKNRFLNIRAYDHSRVVLETETGDLHSDYINADYLSGYGGVEKVYIAAQGPKKTTIDDTWRMIWQTNSDRVIMVTNVVEGGKIKCEQYWPDKGSAVYGKIKVTLVSTDNYAAYVIRIFNVEYNGESRRLRQFHFTSWPDHGVPVVATELLEFRKRVKSFDKDATGPLIIHCSAGVGRTGTYIAVDYCLQQGQQEKEVNVWGITYQMRTERVNMIQTLDQYIFVYDALHEALLSGDTVIQASTFRKEFTELCKEDPDTNKSLLSKQFETLEILKTPPQDGKPLVALESDNIKKNRNQDIVPSNRYRPFLSTTIEGTTSYINAVYADGFRAKLAYLITQMPLPHTVVDLWRLVHDHHSSTIVMLNPLDKNDKNTGVYWPEEKEQTLEFGPLQITMTSVDTEHPHITIRDFKITNAKSKRVPVVRQFQLTSWAKEDAFPEARRAMLELIEMIEKWQKQTGNGPITVHCMDGASRCGLFVSSLYAIEQLKIDQEVDVFRAVKQVRIPRPQFIQDLDQYKFVHEMVLEFIDGFGDYSNFTQM